MEYKKLLHQDWRFDAGLFFAIVAAKELKTEPPCMVKFFREAKPGERGTFTSGIRINGACNVPDEPRTIFIHESVKGSEFVNTVGHEVCHLGQGAFLNEREADEFGKDFAAKFGRLPEHAEIHVTSKELIFQITSLPPCYDPPQFWKKSGVLIWDPNDGKTADIYERQRATERWAFMRTVKT